MNTCSDLDTRTKRLLGRTAVAPYSHALLRQTLMAAGSWPEFQSQMGNLLKYPPPKQLTRIGKALSRLYAAGFCDAISALDGPSDGLSQAKSSAINSNSFLCAQNEVSNECNRVAFCVAGLTQLYQFQSIADHWNQNWPADREELEDDEFQALFDAWKLRTLSRPRWNWIDPDYRALIFEPLIRLSYLRGQYTAHQRLVKPGSGWKFMVGDGCTKHAGLNGLVASTSNSIWNTWLPPLSFGCNCSVQVVENVRQVQDLSLFLESSDTEKPCALFSADKRIAPWDYLNEHMRLMQEQCKSPACFEARSRSAVESI